MPKLPVWGWAALAAASAVAVGGIAYASSGGASTPASGSAGSAGSTSTGGTVTNPGASTTPGATAGMTVAGNAAIVNASQNALALVASSGKVPGLSYSAANDSNAASPAFVAALIVFQKWQNSRGGYTPPGGSPVQLNTAGTLDYATVAAVLTAAST
jgi:hypothetical protein